jgi:hypothetical protein
MQSGPTLDKNKTQWKQQELLLQIKPINLAAHGPVQY